MSRLKEVFSRGKALIPFITAGDPSLETTAELVKEMSAAGADLIELGIPFSDPVAEGVVIQKADLRALAGGVTTDRIFGMVSGVRQQCDVPLAIMTYFNPVFIYGPQRFMRRCAETDIDAIIVPDLPFEERADLLPVCNDYGIDLISMIAPTSQERIHMIAREARGFIYCVSSLGVTGVRQELGRDIERMVGMVKEVKDIPCAVGFGISTLRQAAAMATVADGVIIGSALVKIIEQHGGACLPYVAAYVKDIKEALKEIPAPKR